MADINKLYFLGLCMSKRILLLALGLFFIASAQAQPTLVLNTSYTAPLTTPDHSCMLDLIYKEVGKRLGINIVIQFLPAERCLLNANAGIDDGDVGRIVGLNKTYPNLIAVPESVMEYKMGVFSRKVDFTVAGPDSLKPYDVGIITGWKILERNIVDTHSLIKLEDGEQLFSMLDKNRIDVAVIESNQGAMLIKQLKLKNVKLLQPYFLEGSWYLYLNKRHESMIPQITTILKKMKEDGTYQRIFDR